MCSTLGYRFLIRASRSNRKTWAKSVVPMMVVQNLSTSTNHITNRVITRNLELRQCNDDYHSACQRSLPQRPLVLLFSWLKAKRRHVHKYGDFYLQQGFDVLNVRVHIDHVLYAAGAQKCVQQALDYLSHRAATVGPTPLLVHAFSTGGYVYGEMLIKMAANAERYSDVVGSIGGEIFDSMAYSKDIAMGVGMTVTNNRRLQRLISVSLQKYMEVTHEHTTKHFWRSEAMFYNNYMKCPSLVMYSLTDIIGSPEESEKLVRRWRELEREVYTHVFDNTPHINLMKKHPIKYRQLQQELIDRAFFKTAL